MKINILLMGFVLISGCSTIPNNNFNSTLWIQTSSEYKANSIQVFNNASYKIVQSLNDPNWSAAIEQDDDDYSSLPVAVVMDIDETVEAGSMMVYLYLDGIEIDSQLLSVGIENIVFSGLLSNNEYRIFVEANYTYDLIDQSVLIEEFELVTSLVYTLEKEVKVFDGASILSMPS